MRRFSELSKDEVKLMWSKCVDAALATARELNVWGLMEVNSHNLYQALEEAIYGEWEKSRQSSRPK